MPDRVLRSGLIWSEKINSVSVHAEALFVRLILIADDFGLVDLSPAGLKMRALPGRNATLGEIEEQCRELCEVLLLRGYKVEGKPYGAIVGWNQTRWSKASKLPLPPWGTEHITGGYVAPRAQTDEAAPKAAPSKANGKHPVPAFELPDWLNADTWRDWIKIRPARARTPAAQLAAIAKLERFRAAGHDANVIVSESLSNGHQGLFAPDAKRATKVDAPPALFKCPGCGCPIGSSGWTMSDAGRMHDQCYERRNNAHP